MVAREGGERTRPPVADGVLLALLIVAAQAAWVASAVGPLHRPRDVGETDHHYYIEMARGADGRRAYTREAPFCWRVGVPAAAGALARTGLGLNLAFFLLTNASLAAFLFVLHRELADHGLSREASSAGVAIAGMLPGAVRWYEYQYWMTDPPALLLVALGLRAARRGQDGRTAALGALGALVRESIVLVLAGHAVRSVCGHGWGRGLRRAALVAAPAVAVLAALRLGIPPISPEDPLATVREMVAFRLRRPVTNQLYLLTVGSWGALAVLALLRPRALPAAVARHLDAVAVVAVAYASLLVANNTDRLLVYALPAVLPLALRNVEAFAEESGTSAAGWLAAAVAVQALHLGATPFLGRGTSFDQPTRPLVVAAAVLLLAASFAVRLLTARRRRAQA